MTTRYKNPWHIDKPYKLSEDGWRNSGNQGPEFYETDSPAMEYAGCLIYARQEFGYTIFDVVLNGICVAQRAGINGAKAAAEAREWEDREWWQKCQGVKV